MFLLGQAFFLIFSAFIYLFLPSSAFGGQEQSAIEGCQYGFSDIFGEFSPETQGNLTNAGIKSLETLTARTAVELRRLGFEEDSLDEIKAVLQDKGLSLLWPISVESLALSSHLKKRLFRAGIQTIEELTAKTEENLKDSGFKEKALKKIKAALSARDLSFASFSVDFTRVESLNISLRLKKSLSREGIETIKELTAKTEEDLKDSGFREKALKKIKAALSVRGLSLTPVSVDFTGVESLNTSPHLRNKLSKVGIETIEELTEKTEEGLKSLGFGERALRLIRAALSGRGLSLSVDFSRLESLDISGHLRKELYRVDIKTVEELAAKTEEDLVELGFSRHFLNQIKAALSARGLNLFLVPLDSMGVESLNISPHLRNKLFKAGIETIEELIAKTEEELVELGFKRHSLNQIKAALSARGLNLSDKAITKSEPQLESLGISGYLRNKLYKAADIQTVEELTAKTEEDLLNLGFSKYLLNQIKIALSARGLSLSSVPLDLTGLESLNLYPRLKNVLLREGIKTIDELTERTESELVSLGFGEVALKIVKIALSERGLSLASGSLDSVRLDFLSISGKLVEKLSGVGIHTIKELTVKTEEDLVELGFSGHFLNQIKAALSVVNLSLAVDFARLKSLNLSTRLKNVLSGEGIETVEELTVKTEEDLANMGFKEHALRSIREALSERGLSLAGDQGYGGFLELDLSLSPRLKNELYIEGIHTIEELTMRTEGDLENLGFREHSLGKIREALFARGLSLALPSFTKIESLRLPFRLRRILYEASIYEVTELASKTEKELRKLPGFLGTLDINLIKTALFRRGLWIHFDPEAPSKIESLDLSLETRRMLYRARFRTVKILTRKADEDLMDLPGFTRFHLDEVKAALSKRNLFLSVHPDRFKFFIWDRP